MNNKRKQPHNGSEPRQTKLTHFLQASVPSERCPHCAATFAEIAALIQHVEAEHLSSSDNTQPPAAAPAPAAVEQQVPWWKQQSEAIVAHARFRGSAGGAVSHALHPVHLSALQAAAPVELVLNALPAGLANSLLAQLLAQSDAHFVAGSWWFGGKRQQAPRSSAKYILSSPAAAAAPAPGAAAAGGSSAAPTTATDIQSITELPATPELQEAAALISTAVSTRMQAPQHARWQPHRQALLAQLATGGAAAGGAQPQPQGDASEWRPSYVLANLYADGQQSVGSHSDRLNSLGPLPTIASVSLGAGRVFRLHPADDAVAAAAAAAVLAGGGAGGAGSSSGQRLVSSIDIQLPHNSLLIMHPPTQELWKHEVPKTQRLSPHPVSGSARINLTFRQLAPAAWAAAVPRCRCGCPAIMRCEPQQQQQQQQGSSSSRRLAYYFACDNTQGPGCGLHQRAVAADIPAD